jgi:hypothetical protein
MAQRDNRHNEWVLDQHDPAAGPTGRCPVQPSTPLGPDQVNVRLNVLLVLVLRLHVLAATRRTKRRCRRNPFPHPGDLTGMTEPCGALPRKCLFMFIQKEPCGAYPRKCLFIYLFVRTPREWPDGVRHRPPVSFAPCTIAI